MESSNNGRSLNINMPPINGRLLNIISLFNSPFMININRDNILNRSFNDQGNTSHPTDDKFVESLEKVTFEEDSEICCGICLEEFKKGDEAFILPCRDQKHYFHVGENKETCEGILPWLKENNSCPICREKFPEQGDENTSDIPVPENNFDGDLEENLINEFLQGINIQVQEESSDETEYNGNNEEENNNEEEENNNGEENTNEEEEEEEENNNEEAENNIHNAIDNFLENILMNHVNPNVPRIRIISNIVNHSEEEDFELQQAIQRSLQER